MISIQELVDYSDESYARTDEQCPECQNANCEGSCSRCFNEIHKFSSERDYDCENLIYHYVCEYIYTKSSEITHLFSRHPGLRELDNYQILSIGCGPASELFGIDNILHDSLITFKGFDLNPFWNNIHDRIRESTVEDTNRNIEFYCSNIFEQYQELNFTPNILILSFLISHLPKVGIPVAGFLNELEKVIIDTMPENSYVILNDTNHYRQREYFEMLYRNLSTHENGTFTASRYRYRGWGPYGLRHRSDRLIVPIPTNIRQKYDTWTECGRTAQMVIKKEGQ